MKLLPNTLRGQLGLAFGVVLSLTVLLAAVSYQQIATLGDVTQRVVSRLAVRERAASQWQWLLERDALAASMLIATSDPDKQRALIEQMKTQRAKIEKIRDGFTQPSIEQTDTALLGRIGKAGQQYEARKKDVIDAVASGSSDYSRTEFHERFVPALRTYQAVVEELAQLQQGLMDQGRRDTEGGLTGALRLLLALTVAACAVGATLAWQIARRLGTALGEALRVAQAVSDGDLTARASISAHGEMRDLLVALERMAQRLQVALAEICKTADSVHTAAHEIAQGNKDLSERTEQQASTLQVTASSMFQMTDFVGRNASDAREADQLAATASAQAVSRGQHMNELVSTMDAITHSSGKIAEIVTVIDALAFQTNILALNAAVEAARAGEQGRGFAVVAGEVRSLAQRSATAAKEIRQLISASVERVDSGAKLVSATDGSISELIESVKRVSALMESIATSSTDQSRTVVTVNHAVAGLEDLTQKNAALAEQSAAAAASLGSQADRLKTAVSGFKFD